MFDDDLPADGTAAADALVESVRLLRQAESRQFRLAAHWADLHAPEVVAERRREALGEVGGAELPGTERTVRAGAHGTPLMAEFAAAELGALLGLSTYAGEQLVADAVNLRHRHPQLWAGVLDGRVAVWLARKVARRCAEAGLTLEQALWVDNQTTPYLTALPTGRFLRLVDGKIIAADPEAAQARATEAALARFARAGAVDEHGLRTFVARAAAGDVACFVAVLDRVAAVLGARGDTDRLDVRRAKALGVVANPARALALLLETTLEHAEGPDAAPADADLDPPADLAAEAERVRPDVARGEAGPELVGTPQEPVGWMLDAAGRPLPAWALRSDLRDPAAGEVPAAGTTVWGVAPPGPGDVEAALDPALLRQVLAALGSFDARDLDPAAVLHVHVTADTIAGDDELADGGAADGLGVARVEGVGPLVAATVRRWLSDAVGRVQVRPVLDTRAVHAVDAYEHTTLMREAVCTRLPHEVFPFGTLASRRADLDHPVPYRPPETGGPPGQTGLHNAAPLSRTHHRMKTCGGWVLRQPQPTVFWWRAPHGHWFRVDRHGTHQHGRDPALDARWGATPASPPGE